MKARKSRAARKKYRAIQQQFVFREATLLAGVDEAGRGPLAGPVVASAVILDPRRRIRGLADSKVLAPEARERLAELIRERALAWSVAWADREEIDTINILQATLLAMRRALLGLRICPDAIQVDGNLCPSLLGVLPGCPAVAVVEGDALVAAISAASILAKTFRDAWMRRFHEMWPQYNFASHKGYYTPEHLEKLDQYGACPLHRRSFAPVQIAMGLPVLNDRFGNPLKHLVTAEEDPTLARFAAEDAAWNCPLDSPPAEQPGRDARSPDDPAALLHVRLSRA